MDVFDLRGRLVEDYARYTRSFIRIADARIKAKVDGALDDGALWPEPLLQLNPTFLPGGTIDDLVSDDTLHPECKKIFKIDKSDSDHAGKPLHLHTHQTEAIRKAKEGKSYVLTSGTGSGKSLTYIVPIVDHVLRRGSGQGIQAIVVYPMNALANSQAEELKKCLEKGYGGRSPVKFARYTGQEKGDEREAIRANPPDILLTNYMMLELLLTRREDRALIKAAQGLRFLVFDELHTYRGRQGADVALLIRRCRLAFGGHDIICVGTSATMASEGSSLEQKREVARVAETLFGTSINETQVVIARSERDETATKYRMQINRNHSPAVQFTTLAHELGHLCLGHLGPDKKLNIPERTVVAARQRELEAESVAYLVCERNGVSSRSHTYLANFVGSDTTADDIDVYQIMRAAGQVEALLHLTAHTSYNVRR